jgi:hypothetical protein
MPGDLRQPSGRRLVPVFVPEVRPRIAHRGRKVAPAIVEFRRAGGQWLVAGGKAVGELEDLGAFACA